MAASAPVVMAADARARANLFGRETLVWFLVAPAAFLLGHALLYSSTRLVEIDVKHSSDIDVVRD